MEASGIGSRTSAAAWTNDIRPTTPMSRGERPGAREEICRNVRDDDMTADVHGRGSGSRAGSGQREYTGLCLRRRATLPRDVAKGCNRFPFAADARKRFELHATPPLGSSRAAGLDENGASSTDPPLQQEPNVASLVIGKG